MIYIYLQFFFFFIAPVPECCYLPSSMSSGVYDGKVVIGEKGCPGAIWSSGGPSTTFCTNDDRYPWWQTCCKWGGYGSGCVPKSSRKDYIRILTPDTWV